MVVKLDASFQNGVFVPAERPNLMDREQVRLTVERSTASNRHERDGQTKPEPGNDDNLAAVLDYHPDGC